MEVHMRDQHEPCRVHSDLTNIPRRRASSFQYDAVRLFLCRQRRLGHLFLEQQQLQSVRGGKYTAHTSRVQDGEPNSAHDMARFADVADRHCRLASLPCWCRMADKGL